MKITISALVIVLLAGAASAQTSSTTTVTPDIVVLKKSWRLDVRNPLLDTDPFGANAAYTEALRAQRINDQQNAIRAKGSESREPPPPRPTRTSDSSAKSKVTYVYHVKIKNAGARTIRVVDWGYLFVDPDTQADLGRHRFSSKVKIQPDQNNDLVGRSTTTQTYTVSAKAVGKGLSEQIVIYRIEYDDGSFWQNPAK